MEYRIALIIIKKLIIKITIFQRCKYEILSLFFCNSFGTRGWALLEFWLSPEIWKRERERKKERERVERRRIKAEKEGEEEEGGQWIKFLRPWGRHIRRHSSRPPPGGPANLSMEILHEGDAAPPRGSPRRRYQQHVTNFLSDFFDLKKEALLFDKKISRTISYGAFHLLLSLLYESSSLCATFCLAQW